jgi:hypothetical protein
MQLWTEPWTSGKRLMGRRRGGEESGSGGGGGGGGRSANESENESGSEEQRHQQADEKDIKDQPALAYKISNDEEPARRGGCVASVTTEKTRQRAWVVVGCWRQDQERGERR